MNYPSKKKLDLSPLKQIPIIEVATRLGIQVRGTTAMCFTGHDKASPSLTFRKDKNTWRCFGACGKHGDSIALVMEKQEISFKAAIDWLARQFALDFCLRTPGSAKTSLRLKTQTVSRTRGPMQDKIDEFAEDSELYTWLISKCAPISQSTGLEYLETHGISQEAAFRFKLRELRKPDLALRKLIDKWGQHRVYCSGLAFGRAGKPERLIWNSYSLLFPFFENGSVKYIQARMFRGNRKFLNPQGVPKRLFNIDAVRGLPSGHLVHICEGVPDTIALESRNLSAVGVLGASSFRSEWVDHFLKFNIVLLGDGDAAGKGFAKQISKFFMERGKTTRFIPLPKGHDVADVLAKPSRSK